MAESVPEDEWVLQYYIPTLMCQECHVCFSSDTVSLLSYKETLTNLEEHLFCEHNIDSVYDVENDINKKKIPVRRFIRKHYSKLKGDTANCNLCLQVINNAYRNYNSLHEHLKLKHNDQLTEKEKNDTKFLWFWDYFTITDKSRVKCHKCNIQFCALTPAFLIDHLKTHEKTGPSSSSDTDDTDTDTDMRMPVKKAKRQKDMNSPGYRMNIMAEQEAGAEWVLQYCIPTLMCQECHDPFLHNNASLSSYTETLTKLKEHLLHEHNIKHDSVHNIECDVNKEKIPVRRFIQKHYSKLKGDAAKCNYCFAVISYTNMNCKLLHEHLKCKHDDKLTEIEKKENKILWYWDYFTIKNEMCVTCNLCSISLRKDSRGIIYHLGTHEKTSPSSSSNTMIQTNDMNNGTDMGTPTQKAKHQENTHSPRRRSVIMAEKKAKDQWVLQHYIPTVKCQECHLFFLNNKFSSLSYKETFTKLKEHLLHEHNMKHDSMHDIEYDVNKEKIPVRRFIRNHYSKLKGDAAKCNYCFVVISYKNAHSTLHKHLKRKHKGKLTEIEEKEKRILWYWDYFTIKDEKNGICNTCNTTISLSQASNLGKHMRTHKKTGPTSSSDTNDTDSDTDMRTPVKKAKRQENVHSPYRTDIMVEQEAEYKWVLQYYDPTLMCQECHDPFLHNKASLSLYTETLMKLKEHLLHEHNIKHDSVHNIECDVNKEKIPVRRFIRKHYSKLKRDVAVCNLCFEVINYTSSYYRLHLHLKYKHKDELTEIERNEDRILWYWDYMTIKKKMRAICNICGTTLSINLRRIICHFRTHEKSCPSSSSDTDCSDTSISTPIKEAKRQEDSQSEAPSKNVQNDTRNKYGNK